MTLLHQLCVQLKTKSYEEQKYYHTMTKNPFGNKRKLKEYLRIEPPFLILDEITLHQVKKRVEEKYGDGYSYPLLEMEYKNEESDITVVCHGTVIQV